LELCQPLEVELALAQVSALFQPLELESAPALALAQVSALFQPLELESAVALAPAWAQAGELQHILPF
jgi:hypothetical protein